MHGGRRKLCVQRAVLPYREKRPGGAAQSHEGEEPRGGAGDGGGVVRCRQQVPAGPPAFEQLQHRGQHQPQPEPRHQGRRPAGGDTIGGLPPPPRPPRRPPSALLPRDDGEPLPDDDVRHLRTPRPPRRHRHP